jgi:hypothetical protein
MLDTFDSLLLSFQRRQESHPGPLALWDGFDRQAALEYGTVKLFLKSYSYVRDTTQAADGFRAISAALDTAGCDGLAGLLASVKFGVEPN